MKKFAHAALLTFFFTTPLAPQGAAQETNSVKQVLSEYKNYGMSFSADPNWGLGYDEQNPVITFYFKNKKGDVKKRRYQASIESIGAKSSLCLKFNFALIVGGDFNFENTNKPLNIGSGVELSLGTLLAGATFFSDPNSIKAIFALASWLLIPCVTIAKIDNVPGSYLVMFSYDAPIHFATSYIFGGTLTPLSES